MKYIKNKKKIKALTVSIILALQTNTFAIAAETVVTPDSSNHKNPMVDKAANGTIVVNIRTPNETGLSHNQYKDLQVGNDGIIFNNAREISKTELAGYINGNQYLGSQGADIILNEVTGRNITNLNGFIEVAGKRADVIIANPNGIVGNNFGYINTNRAIITTGVPQIGNNGGLYGYNVSGGEVRIEGEGLDASQATEMDIYSKAVKINAQIAAQKLKMVGGKNELDAAGNVKNVTDNEYTGISLDVGAIGSMYAGAIYMIGTSKGLGVNMEGEASAKQGDFQITSDGKIIIRSQVLAAGNVEIKTAETFENTGGIYGENLKIEAASVENLGNITAPVIAARNNLDIQAETVNNKEHAVLLGANNVSIKADTLNNNSAIIEAGNDINLTVNELNNTNEHYSVEMAKIIDEENIYEVQLDGSAVRYKEGDYRIRHSGKSSAGTTAVDGYDIFYRYDYSSDGDDVDYQLVTPGGYSSFWHEYSYHRVIKEDVIKTTDPAKIIGGRNIKLTGNNVINDKSKIIAGNTLTTDIATFENIDGMGTRLLIDQGRAGAFSKVDAGSQWDHYMDTDESWSDYHKESPIDIVVQEAAHTNLPEMTEEVNADTQTEMQIADSLLYAEAPQTATYYVETSPAFTDKKQWLSSDYFFNQMQYDPEKTMKRVGDGYYEQQIVKDKVLNLTGQYYIGDYSSFEEQYKTLLDNAVEFAKNNTVAIGVALTKEQQETLKEPMVWLIEKSVMLPDGQIVMALVPELYLAKETLYGSAVVSAKNIDLKTTNDIINKGTIIAGESNKLSASNINNIGGTIKGSDVILAAQKDISDIGGILLADKNMDITAGGDINFETTTRTGSTKQGSTTAISQMAGAYISEENGRLTMSAGKDVNLKAAQIAVNGEVIMDAGNNINLGTAQTADNNDIKFGSNNYHKDSKVIDVGTTIYGQGNITLTAGRDLSLIHI